MAKEWDGARAVLNQYPMLAIASINYFAVNGDPDTSSTLMAASSALSLPGLLIEDSATREVALLDAEFVAALAR